MSIIADALKKAEQEKQIKKKQGQNTLTTSAESAPSLKRTESINFKIQKGKWPLNLILVALGVLVILVGSLLLLSKQKSVLFIPTMAKQSSSGIEFSFDVQPRNVTLAPVTAASKPVALQVPVPVPPPSKSEFVLSGIIDDPQKPSAIINNEIVEVGGVIRGAKVIRIDSQRVVLEKDDREISLTL